MSFNKTTKSLNYFENTLNIMLILTAAKNYTSKLKLININLAIVSEKRTPTRLIVTNKVLPEQ